MEYTSESPGQAGVFVVMILLHIAEERAVFGERAGSCSEL